MTYKTSGRLEDILQAQGVKIHGETSLVTLSHEQARELYHRVCSLEYDVEYLSQQLEKAKPTTGGDDE